jgi:glutaredoxin-like protein
MMATTKPEGDPSMTEAKITVYGTNWCGDCRRTRHFLEKNQVEYKLINIDEDKNGEQFVIKTNHGMRSVPTIVFEDGSILVEPSNRALAEKLGLSLNSPIF